MSTSKNSRRARRRRGGGVDDAHRVGHAHRHVVVEGHPRRAGGPSVVEQEALPPRARAGDAELLRRAARHAAPLGQHVEEAADAALRLDALLVGLHLEDCALEVAGSVHFRVAVAMEDGVVVVHRRKPNGAPASDIGEKKKPVATWPCASRNTSSMWPLCQSQPPSETNGPKRSTRQRPPEASGAVTHWRISGGREPSR